MADESPPRTSAGIHREWARTVQWVLVVGILTGAALYVFRSLRDLPGKTADKAGELIHKTGEALAGVAAAFKKGTISTAFVSYATSLSGSQRLQFATLKQHELFSHTQQTTLGPIPLPEVVVEARAPVEYTYYLDLKAPWQLKLADNVIHVYAPRIQFNKPAVDASAITFEVKKGYFKAAPVQEELKQMISGAVLVRATENISLVKETGRRQTGEFVEKWLRNAFPDGQNYPVIVHFPDETETNGIPPITIPRN